MKKLKRFFSTFLSIAVLFAFFAFIFLDFKTSKENDKNYVQRFTAVRVVEIIDSTASIDYIGRPLVVGQWYLMSNYTRVLIPVRWHLHTGTSSENFKEYLDWERASTPDIMDVKLDTILAVVSNGSPLGVNVRVEVVNQGKHKLYTNYDNWGNMIARLR